LVAWMAFAISCFCDMRRMRLNSVRVIQGCSAAYSDPVVFPIECTEHVARTSIAKERTRGVTSLPTPTPTIALPSSRSDQSALVGVPIAAHSTLPIWHWHVLGCTQSLSLQSGSTSVITFSSLFSPGHSARRCWFSDPPLGNIFSFTLSSLCCASLC
jgi:hypothetical protein